MKNLALVFTLASVAAPALAQEAMPSCAQSNFDSERNIFTVVNPSEAQFHQQCYLTVFPREGGTAGLPSMRQYPEPFLTEGDYVVTLSGGGGGGGGGAAIPTGGGGGGGASAAPHETVVHFTPGIYKLTIGRGGMGGTPDFSTGLGSPGQDGAPTSIVNITTGQTVAGFEGADRWMGSGSQLASTSAGGPAPQGGASGGAGGLGYATGQTATGSTPMAYAHDNMIGGWDTSPFSSYHQAPVMTSGQPLSFERPVVGGLDVSPYSASVAGMPSSAISSAESTPENWMVGGFNTSPDTSQAASQLPNTYGPASGSYGRSSSLAAESGYSYESGGDLAGSHFGRSGGQTMTGEVHSSSGERLGTGGGGGAAVIYDSQGRIVSSPANMGSRGGDGFIALRPAAESERTSAMTGSESGTLESQAYEERSTPERDVGAASEPTREGVVAEPPMRRDRN